MCYLLTSRRSVVSPEKRLHGSHLSEKSPSRRCVFQESWADDANREVWRIQSECASWRPVYVLSVSPHACSDFGIIPESRSLSPGTPNFGARALRRRRKHARSRSVTPSLTFGLLALERSWRRRSCASDKLLRGQALVVTSIRDAVARRGKICARPARAVEVPVRVP